MLQRLWLRRLTFAAGCHRRRGPMLYVCCRCAEQRLRWNKSYKYPVSAWLVGWRTLWRHPCNAWRRCHHNNNEAGETNGTAGSSLLAATMHHVLCTMYTMYVPGEARRDWTASTRSNTMLDVGDTLLTTPTFTVNPTGSSGPRGSLHPGTGCTLSRPAGNVNP